MAIIQKNPIGFPNALFHGTHTITDSTYLNGEQPGIRKEDRRAIFDVYCETESGDIQEL